MINFLTVDCINGNDSDIERRLFLTAEAALDNMNPGEKMTINPGLYSGMHLESLSILYPLEIEGFGIKSEFQTLNFYGMISAEISKMRFNCINLSLIEGFVKFENVDFYGNSSFMISKIFSDNKDSVSEIIFSNCTFGINYQLILESGNYRMQFKNCTFRSTRTIPFIYSRKGTYLIDIILCVVRDVPFIFNKNARIEINQINSLISELSLQPVKDNSSQVQNFSTFENPSGRNFERNDIFSFRTVNSADYSTIILDIYVKFLRVIGKYNLDITLPNLSSLKIGHRIEIVNEAVSIRVNNTLYSGECYICAIYLKEGWFVFRV